ncbi:hypothetical protein IQ247_25265 [Plectonema cf. radiosum LEGE 06105]|uniref:Uncharacterized protein n=1 Tax=Plectonema cf. radiosum LEGE 06105 TaxID=945769 RepID=A0A8J7K441_9CYAN|nr:hypothetical protein [Plectonema radiosum]MBE9215932.1 hypothetical protein [Plectonema cf. radiosum LEGE 06105]
MAMISVEVSAMGVKICSWFEPVSDLKSTLLDGLKVLRSQGKTFTYRRHTTQIL